jgi:hypothetical protein
LDGFVPGNEKTFLQSLVALKERKKERGMELRGKYMLSHVAHNIFCGEQIFWHCVDVFVRTLKQRVLNKNLNKLQNETKRAQITSARVSTQITGTNNSCGTRRVRKTSLIAPNNV